MWRIGQVTLTIVIFILKLCSAVEWEKVKCSADIDQSVPEGRAPIGRFPWLGVVQHAFYVGGATRYAVTAGVLIHPGYAIASAEDIVRVPRTQIFNNTKFIVWHSEDLKFIMDVSDYILHPEYEEKVTFATLALIELVAYGATGISDYESVVLPICMPVTGLGTTETMYSVRFTDEGAEMHKEVNKMSYVTNTYCEEYYYQTGLSYDKMKPRRPLCAVVESQRKACVWDAGSVLITRQSWGHWMILGFSTRGAGCGAPARYVSMHDFVPWIDDIITKTSPDEVDSTVQINLRRYSPVAFTMYPGDYKIPKQFGQCLDKKQTGGVLFKDSSQLITTLNYGQGFYFLSVSLIASVKCVKVHMEVLTKSNAAVWVEHMCHRDDRMAWYWSYHREDMDCFMYFKSKAFVELRFYFSFKALFEVTIYGMEEMTPIMPYPFRKWETTIPWTPTADGLSGVYWHPTNRYMWHL